MIFQTANSFLGNLSLYQKSGMFDVRILEFFPAFLQPVETEELNSDHSSDLFKEKSHEELQSAVIEWMN